MRRRDLITLLGGVAVAWPLAARAQQPERMRRIGVLMAYGENDPGAKTQLSGFTRGLAELGWTDSRSVRMDVRWAPPAMLTKCGRWRKNWSTYNLT
jgi:putative tryptophan/tyrosine transport system substrate-binding protein